MCIMEVRSGQHSATIAQALTHNMSTWERDAEMFAALAAARGESTLIASVEQARDLAHRAYAIMLDVYGEEVAAEVADPAGHLHTHDHGNERSFVEVAHHDAQLARRYETR